MGTHRTGWRRTAAAALVATSALTGPPARAGEVEDCGAIEGTAAQSACLDQFGSASAATEIVQSSIVLLDRLPSGEFVFRLANGQAWAQLAARFIAVEAGERVIIAPARLGGAHILATERSATARVRVLVEPSAGEREGLAPRMEKGSAGEREGLAPRMEKGSAGEREGVASSMEQIRQLPMESAFQRPNRGQDALGPRIPPETGNPPRTEGVPPSDGAQRR